MKFIKPESWSGLPLSIQEDFLWDVDLDYCHYESSKAETIHYALLGEISEMNQRIADSAYKFMPDDSVEKMLTGRISSIKRELEAINQLLKLGDIYQVIEKLTV
jgi:hypothetical protein